MGRVRLLLGISVFWLALSMLFDGLNTLVLPDYILHFTSESHKATALGLLTFVGLVAGMLVQPVAGAVSDRLRPQWGRRGMIGLGVLLILVSLAFFGLAWSLLALFIAYLAIQVTAGTAQAAQQGFIPDLVPTQQRGTAAGLKGFMDVGGATFGFVVLGQLLGGGRVGPALFAIGAGLVLTYLLTVALVREPRRDNVARVGRPALLDAFRVDLHLHSSFAWLVASRFLFLLGTYAVGRFFLYFVAYRLGLAPDRAAEQAGTLLGGLALITVVAALPAGWAADRFGRRPLMLLGSAVSALGVLLLIFAGSGLYILLFGSLMSIGSAAFAAANWASTADLAPPDEAGKFLGIANFGTAGAAAAAGLFGPLVDWGNSAAPGRGYSVLLLGAAVAFAASGLVLRRMSAADRPESRIEAGARAT